MVGESDLIMPLNEARRRYTIVHNSEAAFILGNMSLTRFGKLRREGMPTTPEGHYFIPDIVNWLVERANAEKDASKEQLAAFKAKREALAYLRDRHKLIDRHVFRSRVTQICTTIRNMLVSLPGNLNQVVSDEDHKKVVGEVKIHTDNIIRSLGQEEADVQYAAEHIEEEL